MLNFLFPKECLICSKTGSWLCNKCKKNLLPTLPNCYVCKTLSNNYITHRGCKKNHSFSSVITLWKYNEYSKKLMHNFKYKNRYKVGDFIFSLFEEKVKLFNSRDTVLIPLPSHKLKTLERGFNPTEILGKLIAEKLKIDLNTKYILKKRTNLSQASLKYDERVENVKGIFEINSKEEKFLERYNQILILDDIITTGATLNEIAKLIKLDAEINALCIFQGSFRKKKNEYSKFLQSNREKKKKI